MPFQKRRALCRLAVAGAALAALAAPVTAGAASSTPATSDSTACNMPLTTQVFAGFGDLSYYYAAPGGSFESLTWGYTRGVALSTENDPFGVSGATDRYSVRVPARGSIVSGRFCVSELMPHLRFVAKAAGTGNLDVRVDLYRDTALLSSATTTLSGADHAAWAPTAFIGMNTSSLAASSKAQATVTITNRASTDWYVDDVHVDPYAK